VKKNQKIGFIGQGWIGKNYADDFEGRGFEVVRYSLEEPHVKNGDKISDCDVVFIAVPTPTTVNGFSDLAIRDAIRLIGNGKIAVIKSTMIPGTTKSIQEENPNIFVLHSPEFLTEKTAAHDAANPDRNIVGLPIDNKEFRVVAERVLSLLPKASYNKICSSDEAEFIKYGGNNWFYFKIIFINMLYDLSQKFDTDWSVIEEALANDSRIGLTHLTPIHQGGRGAGGNCFIKDFAAFRELYEKIFDDKLGNSVLNSLEKKNIKLLVDSNKNLDLLKGVYGSAYVDRF
jgi:nucleotide sugar dehydrogenase